MQLEHNSPNYYIRRRLFNNYPAMVGLSIILLAALVAILGYTIMPDDSPNANDGAIQLQKQLPGFRAKVLKIRKNAEIEDRSWFGELFFGQPSPYLLEPMSDYRIDDLQVIVTPYGERTEKRFDLVGVVLALFVGDHQLPDFPPNANYVVEGDVIRYLSLQGQEERISKEALLQQFEEENVEERLYLLGTDKSGRDMLSRLMYGARISLSIGLVSVLVSLLLGVTFGSLAGYFGGWVDSVIMWLMSVVWSIPGIMLVIAISLALQSRGVFVAFIAVGLTMWVDVARVVRGEILSIKEKLYIEAARAYGLNNRQIIWGHVLPNLAGSLIVIATANFAAAILLEAGLSFLGLSVQPPTPSWGIMIYEGYHAIGTQNSWHLVVFPAVAISLMVLSFNLLGNGLRDAFDPKTLVK
jgi:ABC-type dipeptide/oligopeptide/nickel transport system permease subunit